MNNASMKWTQIAFCKYEAVGNKGDFLIWKDGDVWKGLYRSKNKQHTTIFVNQKSLKKMQQICESSNYWE